MKRVIAIALVLTISLFLFTGCEKEIKTNNPNLDLKTPVVINVAGPWTECKALDVVCSSFSEKYPNVTINYEYVQDYYDSLAVRLASNQTEASNIDLFISTNIQTDSPIYKYSLELNGENKYLDLSSTFKGLIDNFSITTSDGTKELYCIPLGAEVRGLFVNKTLLNSLGLKVPENVDELFSVCKMLRENGYIAFQGNPGYFGQRLMYPYVCNIVANSDNKEEIKKNVANCSTGVSEYFRQPMKVLYELVKNNYYNYKYVETEMGQFTDFTDEATVCDFLDIKLVGEEYKKNSDVGNVAFMPGVSSLELIMDKVKSDYHSNIDYEFILSPVGENGGFAYMSPTHGIAVNKNSVNKDWAIEFLNYLFTPENNKAFAKEFACIANTTDAFDEVSKRFSIPESNISELGQVTFDYSFYKLINETLVEISKSNNPKYMDKDDNGNSVMYNFTYYMKNFETRFETQKNANQKG